MQRIIILLALFSLSLLIQAGELRFLETCGQGQLPGVLWGCDDCSDGYGSYPGATTCYSCRSGYYLAGNDNCQPCPTGTYTSFSNSGDGIAYSCTPCLENSTNFGTGNTGCYSCEPGFYLATNTISYSCPFGTMSAGGAALGCIPKRFTLQNVSIINSCPFDITVQFSGSNDLSGDSGTFYQLPSAGGIGSSVNIGGPFNFDSIFWFQAAEGNCTNLVYNQTTCSNSNLAAMVTSGDSDAPSAQVISLDGMCVDFDVRVTWDGMTGNGLSGTGGQGKNDPYEQIAVIPSTLEHLNIEYCPEGNVPFGNCLLLDESS